MKKSGYLQRQQAAINKQNKETRLFTIQQCKDIALIACNEAFGFGPDRLKQFSDAFERVFLDYADLVIQDSKEDKEIWYSKAKMDERLKEICGEYFTPWEERYG